ncbi:hypothetical protein MBLNU459_g3028t1 [Dothideomycetes sp. NU459]
MPTVFAVDDRQDPNRTSDLDAKVLDVQRHAFDQSDFPEMRQTSMADMSLRRNTCYNQGTSQQDQMPRLPSAHTYPSTDFSPLHDFPPVTSHQKMSAQVYDPQLVAMDHQTTSSDVMMDAFNPPTSGSNIDDTYPGMLQFWLSQADSEFGYASLDMPDISQSPFGTYQTYPPDPVQSIPGPSAPSEISDGTTTVSSVPNERLSRVESAWVANTGRPLRFTPTLWHDIKQSPGANLFSQSSASTSRSDVSKSESRWGIDSSLKQRLEMEFGTSSSNFPQSGKDNSFPRPSNLAFPPPEVLDISLDVYFRRFHPIAPFVHVPTFSAGSAPLPLLYAMCILGLSALKPSRGGNFIKHAFMILLRRATSDLAADAVTASPPSKRLAIFATGFLTLSIASLSGDMDQISQGQVLHTMLLSTSQRLGLFAATDINVETILPESMDLDQRWKAWARIESAKRLTVSLLTTDWWYSAYFSVSPTVRPEEIQICLPCDNLLFKAQSADQWLQLIQSGRRIVLPMVLPRTFNLKGALDSIICLSPALDAPGQFSLLSVIKLCLCDATHRHFLPSDHWDRHDHLIPWKCFKDDLRGRSLVPVTLSLSPCVTASPKTTDLNSLVLWHNICMTLNANIQIFELAAGRRGAGRAGKALADVVDWSQTPAARRACIHAAQVFKLLAGRKVSESITLNALTALFHAALVLGLYLFSVPREESNNTANSGPMFEILDEVDWITVGDSGMSDRSSEENQDVLFNPTQFPDPATAFIELGGNISIGGVPSLPGYASSRTTLLEYANVMDGMGAWKPRTLSRILHIMSDVLEETT